MKRFVLRNNPFFEIVLNEDSFEINNTYFTYNNGVYQYEEFLSVEFLESKMDWFPTILGNLIALMGRGGLGIQNTDNRFLFKFESGKKMEVKFINCDIELVNELFQKLQQRIHL